MDTSPLTPRQLREAQLRAEREATQQRLAAERKASDLHRAVEVQRAYELQHIEQQRRLSSNQELAERLRIGEQSARLDRQKVTELLKAIRSSHTTRKRYLEAPFEQAWQNAYPDISLEAEYHILRYRVDFAHVATKTAIELDGDRYHRHARRSYDYDRQRAIEAEGWHFIRFSGGDVLNSIEYCINIAFDSITQKQHGR